MNSPLSLFSRFDKERRFSTATFSSIVSVRRWSTDRCRRTTSSFFLCPRRADGGRRLTTVDRRRSRPTTVRLDSLAEQRWLRKRRVSFSSSTDRSSTPRFVVESSKTVDWFLLFKVHDFDDLYLRFSYVFGKDWDLSAVRNVCSFVFRSRHESLRRSGSRRRNNTDRSQNCSVRFQDRFQFSSRSDVSIDESLRMSVCFIYFDRDSNLCASIQGLKLSSVDTDWMLSATTLFEVTARHTFLSFQEGLNIRVSSTRWFLELVVLLFRHRIRLPLFVPRSSSRFQQLLSWFMGRRPEFTDPKVISMNAGRESSLSTVFVVGRFVRSFSLFQWLEFVLTGSFNSCSMSSQKTWKRWATESKANIRRRTVRIRNSWTNLFLSFGRFFSAHLSWQR